MNFDLLTFHYDNVGNLYGPNQYKWLLSHGHKVNYRTIDDWKHRIELFNKSDANILMTWGVDQHTIDDFFCKLSKLKRNKYTHWVHYTTEPVYGRFAFWLNHKHNAATQHNRFLEAVHPTLLCYACKEDTILSKFSNKLWVCNNQYGVVNITPWYKKQDTIGFSGKLKCWEDYQSPEYKGLGRWEQVETLKKILGNRLVHYPPNTFKMNESLIYHNRHRYILCPRAGHIFHPRLSIAAQIRSIPIIILPNNCPEISWFPELKHGENCFIVHDNNISTINNLSRHGNNNMAENVSKLQTIYNFEKSMQDVMGRLK